MIIKMIRFTDISMIVIQLTIYGIIIVGCLELGIISYLGSSSLRVEHDPIFWLKNDLR